MNPVAMRTDQPDRAKVALPLDLIERIFLLVTLGWFLSHLLASLKLQPLNIFLIVSESLPVLFTLIRKTGLITSSRIAWSASIVGTFTPLLILPGGVHAAPPAVFGTLMAAGLLIGIAAKLSLNRRFGIVPANRGLARAGAYRYVRHPMYLGYMVSHIGFLLGNLSGYNLVVYGVTWAALLFRIRLEESLLSNDSAYLGYRQVVKYRLVPGLY